MRWLILLMAPAVYGQGNPPGLVTVTAGALSCGAVMRASDQIQTYCYAPGLKLVHNTINTVNRSFVVDYVWCVDTSGCVNSHVAWAFHLLSAPQSGISYNISANGRFVSAGTLYAVYGTSGSLCPKLPVPWSGVALTAEQKPGMAMLWTRGTEVCASWVGEEWVTCPPANVFLICGGTFQSIAW